MVQLRQPLVLQLQKAPFLVNGLAVRIAVDVVTLAAGVVVAYVGFSSVRDPVADLSTLILYPWIVILGIFMWRKTSTRKVIDR